MNEPYFAHGTNAMVALDGMVNAAGLRNVIWALAQVFREKAKRHSGLTGKTWQLEADRLDRFALEVVQ